MQKINDKCNHKNCQPIRVIQFGEGNFLRAFVDFLIQKLNEETDYLGSVAVVQPIENGLTKIIDEQNGYYTHIIKGMQNGVPQKECYINNVISKTVRPYENFAEYLELAYIKEVDVIISNTTEAGIVFDETDNFNDIPPSTFPAKLTRLLFERYNFVDGNLEKGYSIVPCELNDNNGARLKKCVKQYIKIWELGKDFEQWVEKACDFISTLVDRIVPGFPKDNIDEIQKELGYTDSLVVESERFLLWVIEDNERLKERLPLHKINADVVFADDIKPYKTRKVRILNGLHTFMVPIGLCAGIKTVRESVEHGVIGKLIHKVLAEEIIPSVDMDETKLKKFGEDVIERFLNPYIKHELTSISLNSISKFKTRVLPSILGYIKKENALPRYLLFSLASLLVFYKKSLRDLKFTPKDEDSVLTYFDNQYNALDSGEKDLYTICNEILAEQSLWGEDLTTYENLSESVARDMENIMKKDYLTVLKGVLDE